MAGFPSRYIVFDIESTIHPTARKHWTKEHKLRLGLAKVYDYIGTSIEGPIWHGFEEPEGFHELLCNMPRSDAPIYLFAHNIGYDLRMVRFFDLLTAGKISLLPPEGMKNAGRWKEPLVIVDGIPTMIRFFRPDGQRFMAVDSLNWFTMKLAELGEMVECPKAEMPPVEATDADWYKYCQRDVDVLDKALRRLWGWLQCLGLTEWSPTPAAQAMLTYRMRFEKRRIARPEDRSVNHLARHSYYGGRVEPYMVGRIESMCHELDVTSLYPTVMKDEEYPCEIAEVGDGAGCSPGSLGRSPLDLVAEVWIDSPDVPYPLRASDGTWWVAGSVRTVMAGPELARAISLGHVVKVGRYVAYKRINLFREYINLFWGLRHKAQKRKDAMIEKVCKILMNALHGKFGQRDGEWIYQGKQYQLGDFMQGRRIDPDYPRGLDVRVLDGHYFERSQTDEHKTSYVPISAWVTSYARLYVDNLIKIAGRENVHYIAVDALVVNGIGLSNLQMAGRVNTGLLGDLRYKSGHEWLNIIGANAIETPECSRIAGIKSGSHLVADGIWGVEEWESLGEAVFSGQHQAVYTRDVVKRTPSRYARRRIVTGGMTQPWLVNNWSETPEETASKPAAGRLFGGDQ